MNSKWNINMNINKIIIYEYKDNRNIVVYDNCKWKIIYIYESRWTQRQHECK